MAPASPFNSPHPRLILLVEDSEEDALLLRRAFHEVDSGITVQVAANGRQAKDYLIGHGFFADRRQYPLPDLVLLDIRLPAISGLELLVWVRSADQFRTLPILMLTSSSLPEDLQRAYTQGANAYFVKPSGLEALRTLARSVVGFWLQINLRPEQPTRDLPRR